MNNITKNKRLALKHTTRILLSPYPKITLAQCMIENAVEENNERMANEYYNKMKAKRVYRNRGNEYD